MKTILLSIPLHRTGGIASWGQKYYHTCRNPNIKFIAVDNAPYRSDKAGMIERVISGLVATRKVIHSIKEQCKRHKIDVIHTTTSGSIGSYRDILIGWFCRRNNIRSILHCHYGSIPEVLDKGGFIAFLTLKALKLYDQVWVLDRRTFDYLKGIYGLGADVKLVPNSIEVPSGVKIVPKNYRDIAFIGNLIPDKGLFDLVKAVKQVRHEVRLHIVGGGADEVVAKLETIAGTDLGGKIKLYGRLPNDKAVLFMSTIDIVALPSYMRAEAFPISILEAMSLGKLVISTRRAAIQDMLTGLDDLPCGIFVRERNPEDIAKAITWCVENPMQADVLCQRAYEKVYRCYRTEVVHQLYTACYNELLKV